MTAAHPAPAPVADRRVATRRQPAMGTICRFETGPGGRPAIGLLWNISVTGVSMLLHEPWQSGTIMSGVLETLTGNHALAVTGRVIHVKQLETGDYFVGAHFVQPITDEELKPFVS